MFREYNYNLVIILVLLLDTNLYPSMRDFQAITDEDKSLIRKLCSAGEVEQDVTVLCLNVASQKESGEIYLVFLLFP